MDDSFWEYNVFSLFLDYSRVMSVGVSMYDGLDGLVESNESTPDNGLENTGGTTKKLARGISRATENAAIVSYARSHLASLGALDTPEFTFSLPDLSVYPGIRLIYPRLTVRENVSRLLNILDQI
jgi:hypothetical protein